MTMDENKDKIWHRPWSTEEFLQNSENWTLAGDVALLNTIKAFANTLFTKVDDLNSNINELVHNLDKVGLKLEISQNEFQNLKNTQFIESRVYDDDEAMDSKENIKVADDPLLEKSEEHDSCVNLNSEIKLLDKYYEMVEISISDSEDESEKSFVLKPKDIYEDRQLPPLIGSDEWYKNWYIEDQTSDVDSQKSSDVYSESDSDDNLPKDLFNGSETSSELNFSHQTNEDRPVANSTFKDIKRKPKSVTSSDESDDLNSLQTKAPISNQAFAEQLAARLDNVISKEENLSAVVNTKPIQPPKTDTISAGLFSNEPPPLSDSEEKTTKGIFSGGKNLFDDYDDEEDDSIFQDNNKKEFLSQSKNVTNDLTNKYADRKNDIAQVSKGLFDSDNSDNDLFVPKSQNVNKPPFLQPNKPIVPLFVNEPPSLSNEEKTETVKKKPTGGVSIFGNKDIGDILKNRNQIDSNDKQEISITKTKKSNLFDDDDDEDFFKKVEKPKNKNINLFDEDLMNSHNNQVGIDRNDNLNKDKMFNSQVTAKKVISLFDDDDLSNDDDIFANVDKPNNNNNTNSLFSDINDNRLSNNNNLSLFDDEINAVKENDNNNIVNQLGKEANEKSDEPKSDSSQLSDKNSSKEINDLFASGSPKKTKKISLFDDIDEDEDDIFSNVTKKLDFKLFEDPESSEDLFTIKDKDDDNSVNVKSAEIKKTSDIIKKEENVKNIDNSKLDQNDIIKEFDNDEETEIIKEQILAKPESLLFPTVTQSQFKNNEETIIKDKNSPKSEVLAKPHTEFDDKILKNDEEVMKLIKENIPPKPELTAKSHLIPNNEETKAENQKPLAAKLPPETDNFPPQPEISLFGSSPPPDDDDWDTKSDNFSDTEDFISYHEDDNTLKPNLFDNEPPSLNEYEVGNKTKIDTNGSYASSSSRLSDIFSDQDSKNKTESSADPEGSKMTTKDVTPSGEFDDSITPKVSLSPNESDNLNKTPSDTVLEKKEEKPVIKKENRIKPEVAERKTNIEKSINKIASITERLKNQSPTKSPEKKVSPGKLKPTLNINVNALLPGLSQPKIKSLTKPQPKDEEVDTNKYPTTPSIQTDTSPIDIDDSNGGFDTTDNVNILTSITKERVRNPARRRPSTRRGRQEALRASVIVDEIQEIPENKKPQPEDTKILEKENPNTIISEAKILNKKTNLFDSESESDQEDDHIFGSSKQDEIVMKDEDIFGSSKLEDSIGDSDIKDIKADKLKKSLFDDSSSDDDLFLGKSKGTKKMENVPKPVKIRQSVKKLENVETEEDPLSNLLK